jgi:hypothetical protein
MQNIMNLLIPANSYSQFKPTFDFNENIYYLTGLLITELQICMKNIFLNNNYLKIFLVVLILLILITSCNTTTMITSSQINENNYPQIIKLKDNTEYKIYSGNILCRVSGDSLLIYDYRYNNTIEAFALSSVDQLIKTRNTSRPEKDNNTNPENKPNNLKNRKIIILVCIAAACLRVLTFL